MSDVSHTEGPPVAPPAPEVVPSATTTASVTTTGRHVGQRPQTESELAHTSQSPQWGEGQTAVGHAMQEALKGETTEALRQNQSEAAQEILRQRENATLENVIDTLSPEQQRNLVETGEGPLIPRAVAQVIKDQGLSLYQARTGLLIKYPEAQVDKIMSQVGSLLSADGYNPPKDEAPEVEEAKLTKDEKTNIQALKNDERVKALAGEAREALKNPSAMSDAEKATWMERVKEIFDGTPGKVLGKAVKYTTVGVGIFAIILVFLMVMHTGGKK